MNGLGILDVERIEQFLAQRDQVLLEADGFGHGHLLLVYLDFSLGVADGNRRLDGCCAVDKTRDGIEITLRLTIELLGWLAEQLFRVDLGACAEGCVVDLLGDALVDGFKLHHSAVDGHAFVSHGKFLLKILT